MPDKNSDSKHRNTESALFVIIVLAGLSLLVSIYLNHIHYKIHTDTSFSSICAVSEEVNCETVALSAYSVFLGLPISYWGIIASLTYMLAAGLCLRDTRRRGEGPRGWGLLFVMGIAGVACSAILFYISHFIIHSICPFCMAIYVLQVAIALTVGVTVARREQGVASALKRDLRELLPRPPAAAVLLPAVVLAAGGYILYPTIYDTTACPTETEEDLCTEPLTYGRPDARIKIVEYSDYECPFCSMTHFALRKAVDTYPGDVSLEHVHFPLDDACNPLLTRPFHENACEAARASICAERQDRFWDMNDWLYTHQKKIGDADWGDVAEEVGVDPERFLGCMDDPASLEVVERDIQRAAETTFVKQGSVGTPIIFINDRGHMGGINWRELQKYLVREFDLPPSPETEKR